MSQVRYIVAIDPGTHTGVAVYSIARDKVLDWYTRDFYTVQDFLVNSFQGMKDQVVVCIEKPPTFLYKRHRTGIAESDQKVMFYAGGTYREAELLAGTLRRLGFTVRIVPPVGRTKWKQEEMELATRSRKRSNPNERDATRLALHYGREERLKLRIKA